MTTAATAMTYDSFPHPPTGLPVGLDDPAGHLSSTSSVGVDEYASLRGTGIEDEAVGSLKGLIATGGGGGRCDLGGGQFLLSPSSPVKDRSRRATMPQGFKSRTHEVLTPSRSLRTYISSIFEVLRNLFFLFVPIQYRASGDQSISVTISPAPLDPPPLLLFQSQRINRLGPTPRRLVASSNPGIRPSSSKTNPRPTVTSRNSPLLNPAPCGPPPNIPRNPNPRPPVPLNNPMSLPRPNLCLPNSRRHPDPPTPLGTRPFVIFV